MRLHPGVGFPLERYVPQEGLDIGDFHIPAGTIVGMNAWVVHRDKTIYGEDAGSFLPDRWIDAEPEQLKLMEKYFFSVCIRSFLFPLPAYLSVSLIIETVWCGHKDMHWYVALVWDSWLVLKSCRQEHLDHGNGKDDTTGAEKIRYFMGLCRERMDDQDLLVREADGISSAISPESRDSIKHILIFHVCPRGT